VLIFDTEELPSPYLTFIQGCSDSNVFAHGFSPNFFGPGSSFNGDIHFDDDNFWADTVVDDFAFLPGVAVHEIGHALGIGCVFVLCITWTEIVTENFVFKVIQAGENRSCLASQ